MLCRIYFTCLIINVLTQDKTPSNKDPAPSFEWDRSDFSYNCIVGIKVNSQRVGQGVIVNMRTVVTSANPINDYINNPGAVTVFSVEDKIFNNSVNYGVHAIRGNQVKRESVWVQIGDDRANSPIHDIVLIILNDNVTEFYKIATFPFSDKYLEIPESGWSTAGFGYTDAEHIKKHRTIEITNLNGKLVDCDEWFPRDWGHFICLDNEENLPGVPSGGPLFHVDYGRVLFGLGCFALRKGNESILVFTNLVMYRFGLSGYFYNPTVAPDTPKTRSRVDVPTDPYATTTLEPYVQAGW